MDGSDLALLVLTLASLVPLVAVSRLLSNAKRGRPSIFLLMLFGYLLAPSVLTLFISVPFLVALPFQTAHYYDIPEVVFEDIVLFLFWPLGALSAATVTSAGRRAAQTPSQR